MGGVLYCTLYVFYLIRTTYHETELFVEESV